MTLTEAKTLIDEWCYENKHNILMAYYSGDVLLEKSKMSKAVVVIVDYSQEEFIEHKGDLTVVAVKKEDFWVSVVARAGIDLGGDIGGFEHLLTADFKFRRKSQCINDNGKYKCISSHPVIPVIDSIDEVLKYSQYE